jgi:hypothetical protein
MSGGMKATRKKRTRIHGLIGLFGHTYIEDDRRGKMVQYQFKIIRKMDGGRYVFQYFSFMDGSPTSLGIMSEAELLGPNVKLYATAELWNEAYEKDCYQRRARRAEEVAATN